MNKFLIISVVFLMIQTMALSQGPVNIGIKFGTNSSRMLTDIDDVLNENINEEEINNYLVGAFVRVNAGRLYVQPEAYFNTKGGLITPVSNNEFQIPTSTTFNYETIDVPLLLGIKLIDGELINVRLHGGPVFSYVTANSLASEISDFDPQHLNDTYMGWQLGAGIDVWFITFDARIENSANILSSESSFEARNRVYLLSAGIKLF
ncbi:outer membrane beta-barrel protein [Roseimarinus sediminis]|jgi:hypothetical protein|uniref:outer membrane beta-barrel protein n=1 Tax=Roseimarinus sediminis TaxID=1610899 RepID=UPI003D245409